MNMWNREGGEVTEKRHTSKYDSVRLVRTSYPEGWISMKNIVNMGEKE
jgi:hypothetical protein